MSLTEEDVKRIIRDQSKSQINPNTVQWMVRAAYEEGWRDAGGDPAISSHDALPIGWRVAWLNSKARNMLVRNNLISGEDNYK